MEGSTSNSSSEDEMGIPNMRCDVEVVVEPSPSDKTVADVVFVHGFGCLSEEPWQPRSFLSQQADSKAGLLMEPQKNNACFWPAALLPRNLGNVRIIIFQYELLKDHIPFGPQVDKDLVPEAIIQQSWNFLRKIRELRGECRDRPLIFVTHSGGTVLAINALAWADITRKNSKVKNMVDIVDSTSAIVYFGHSLKFPELSDALDKVIERKAQFEDPRDHRKHFEIYSLLRERATPHREMDCPVDWKPESFFEPNQGYMPRFSKEDDVRYKECLKELRRYVAEAAKGLKYRERSKGRELQGSVVSMVTECPHPVSDMELIGRRSRENTKTLQQKIGEPTES